MIITGGAGFIGGHLAKRLDGFVWDRKFTCNPLDFYPGHTKIIHLAASTYLTYGYDKQLIEDNITLVDKVFDYNADRLIYASSAAVYNLNNLYAYSKKYAEDLFADCNATGLRYYNVYGPNDNGVVGKLIRCAMTGDYFPMNGGEQVRDFVYIDDIVQATIDAIDSREKIIEVGTGVGTSLYDLMRLVEKLTGRTVKIGSYRSLSNFETKVSICPNPLKTFTSLEEGLKKTIAAWPNAS